jgi:hypothetical protein
MRLLHGDRLCRFAVSYGNGATLRCGIWSVRPGPCRLYPFAVELDDTYYRVGDESFCPISWLQDDETRKNVKSDAVLYREDCARDKKLVSGWNRGKRSRTWDDFVVYMINEMGPKEGYNPKFFEPLPDRPFFNI